MIHPDTQLQFISPEVGYGVVATKLIPKGTITWVFDPLDQVFTPDQAQQMHPAFQEILKTYCYRDHRGDLVLCWDHARFVNHSFNSSCVSTAYNFEIAVRDIQPGEELTDDYGYLNITEPFDCLPEAGTTRRRVMPDDLLHYHGMWDEKVKDAMKHLNKVPQPFLKFIDPAYRQKVLEIAAGAAELDSILNCYYAGETHIFSI